MTIDAMASLFQHVATTSGVTVRVSSSFMPDQSRIAAGRWFWVYHIRIENGGEDSVQLITRHWRIKDALGLINIVEGDGVVGETPCLEPGQTHDYVSGCELTTHHGSMEGHYTFIKADGSLFEVAIPHFSLSAPEEE